MAKDTDAHGGRFIRAIGRKGERMEGQRLAEWKAKILCEHDTNEELPQKIYYETPRANPPSFFQNNGARGTAAPYEHSFVYLDVGAWIGSKDGKWGGTDTGDGRYLKRDLGVVCGSFVALLSFSCAYHDGDCEAWKTADKSAEPLASFARLLELLSKRVETDGLQRAVVRDFMIAASTTPHLDEDPVMYVVLGDMHVPVVDTLEQAKSWPFEFEKRARTKDRKPIWQGSGRVPRFGRIDVRALESIIAPSVAPKGDGGPVLREFAGLYKARTVSDVGPILGRGMSVSHDDDGLLEDTMSEADAERWWAYYHDGIEGGKPADIFENAGDDLVEFALRLEAYARVAREEKRIRARLVQVGDMLDFWVGFNCHYETSPAPDLPVSTTRWGDEFVRHWAYNALGKTKQGRQVARAMHRFSEGGLNPVYLYGNHDNYLGRVQNVKYQRDESGRIEKLAPRTSVFQAKGVFIEHGHRWESSNADHESFGQVVSGLAWRMLGDIAPLGLFVTQAAFIRPEPIRLFEGKAAGAIASGYGQRLDQVVGAVERFLAAGSGFSVYVMGHTHSACLTRIVLAQPPAPKKLAVTGTSSPDKPQVVLTVEGKPFENTVYVEPGRKATGVSWTNILTDGCIVMEDKYAPPRGFEHAVKDSAIEVITKSTDARDVPSLPPGAYLARYYLTRRAEKPALESSNTLVVVGLSIAGDETHREGIDFDFNPQAQRFDRPIVLRWGFVPDSLDGREAWFGLFRPGEPDHAVSIIDPNEPAVLQQLRTSNAGKTGSSRPNGRRFFDVQPQHVFWGSRDLAHLWNGAWGDVSKMAGEWQVRAFNDFARKKKLGQIEFFVHVGDETKKSRAKK
ncbi:MAG TPA: hypothetical protein PK156_03160 [Polyangium sp.]|nr:hypothetical protein [Polyangium sp.]